MARTYIYRYVVRMISEIVNIVQGGQGVRECGEKV